MEQKKLVVFDVDGTLVNFSSERIFVFDLFKRKKIKLLGLFFYFLPIIFGKLNLHSLRRYFYEKYSRRYLKNLKMNEIEEVVNNLWEQKLRKQINLDVLKTIRSCKERDDYYVILLSASLDFLLKPLFEYVEADYLICSRAECKKNKYTGKLLNKSPIEEEKVNALKRFISNKKQRREDFKIISYANDEKLDGYLFEYSDESYIIDKNEIKKYHSF